MLFKLSFRNIKRSLKDYTVYFFTLVLGISLFYVFNAIESQTAMMDLSETMLSVVDLMGGMMMSLSVLVAIILGLLIIYANRFLMKRRKKELGIYMTLGMGKGQISRMLLFETLLIGLFSLIVGILIGAVLSQLMSVLVASMFEANMTKFEFIFSTSALAKTVAAFGVIYIIVMVLNTVTTGRQRLVKLIHSDKTNEKIKVRSLPISIIVMIASLCILAYAYIEINQGIDVLEASSLAVLIGLGCFGTLLFFWGIAGLALRVLPRFRNFYYKNINSFVFREVNSKVNTTVVSMTVICILLFFTIVIFSSAISMNQSVTSNLKKLIPVDFEVTQIVRDDNTSAEKAMQKFGFNLDEDFNDITSLTIYNDDNITYRQTIGESIINELAPYDNELLLQTKEDLVHVSEYNALAKLYNNEIVELASNEYAVVANFDMMVPVRNKSLQTNSPTINISNEELTPKRHEVYDGFIQMSSNETNTGIIVVPDGVNLSGKETQNFVAGNYAINSDADKESMDKRIYELSAPENSLLTYTRSLIYDQSVGVGAMITFIGLYLGIIFLIASAALLSLKELSESSDNQEKYLILQKLGVDQKRLNRALFAQVAIFFGLPLLLAIVHSVFGIMFVNKIILAYMTSDLLTPIIMTAVFIILIYGGYFVITYFTSKRIVMNKS